MLARNRMTKDPLTVDPGTSMFIAWKLMQDRRIRHLPVVDAGRLVGIVTDRDLRLALPSPATSLEAHEVNYLLDKMTVSEVMTKAVIATTPSALLEEAAATLLRHRIGALPVIEGDRLVGILTRSDVLASVAAPPAAGALKTAA